MPNWQRPGHPVAGAGRWLSDLVGKMNLRFVWLDENIKIQRFTVWTATVDAIRYVKVDGFGA